eukprot:CAMPEP_0172361156 /NCGR_PEP_ID=MMETSP1060-20121228/5040_1 /TAXON_ID=37318 /ORGANISM="Pseudo-nitzschia pungens, Strain cf. cingulata" /LENGTH=382 /DNA_ID=CAMNT_0013083335 /DNA_START=299 /DNA_END=1444 /DNA_ORIENTATION=+
MSTSLGSADSEDETLPYHLLLDESVLLYSQVARQTSFESNKEIEMLRKNELTLLVEDTVFDERGFILVDSEEENEQIMKNSKGEKEPETLDEISQALDQQILLGYEAEFTEEQLEQWVGQIDALYEKLQSQAAALPPASSLADTSTSKETETAIETTTATTTTTTFDKLRSRLESMRTLIDPAGNGRWQPPLARLVVESAKSSSQQTPKPSPPAVVKTETKTPDEGTGIETPLKTSLPSDTPSKIENNTADPIDEITNEQNPTPNISSALTSEPGGNKWVEVARDGNETSTSANVTAGDGDGDASDQQPLPHSVNSRELEGTDIVSTVVTTAAIGAAAVTKLPLFVAGVALGPVIRDSIAYAKGRMANNTKMTSIEIDGNST